jgi:hypothetical protein
LSVHTRPFFDPKITLPPEPSPAVEAAPTAKPSPAGHEIIEVKTEPEAGRTGPEPVEHGHHVPYAAFERYTPEAVTAQNILSLSAISITVSVEFNGVFLHIGNDEKYIEAP